MDWSEYLQIMGAADDRLEDLRRVGQVAEPREAPMSTLAKLLFLASALRAQPRAIDRYIDYFGDRLPQRR